MEDSIVLGGSVAAAMAFVEGVKFAIARYTNGRERAGYSEDDVRQAEWRTRIEQLMKNQYKLLEDNVHTSRTTNVLLEQFGRDSKDLTRVVVLLSSRVGVKDEER